MTAEDLDDIKRSVRENTRAIRGYNGDPGLVGDVGTLRKDVAEIKINHLPHIQKNIQAIPEKCKNEVKVEMGMMEVRIMAAIEKKLTERTKNIWKDWIAPIAFPVITTALLIWIGLS